MTGTTVPFEPDGRYSENHSVDDGFPLPADCDHDWIRCMRHCYRGNPRHRHFSPVDARNMRWHGPRNSGTQRRLLRFSLDLLHRLTRGALRLGRSDPRCLQPTRSGRGKSGSGRFGCRRRGLAGLRLVKVQSVRVSLFELSDCIRRHVVGLKAPAWCTGTPRV